MITHVKSSLLLIIFKFLRSNEQLHFILIINFLFINFQLFLTKLKLLRLTLKLQELHEPQELQSLFLTIHDFLLKVSSVAIIKIIHQFNDCHFTKGHQVIFPF